MGKKLMFPSRDNGNDREVNWLHVFQVLGIILSILFVGYELMKSNSQNAKYYKLTLAKNTQDLQNLSASFTIALMKNQANMNMWSTGKSGYHELSLEEKNIYHELLHWWLMFYQNIISQKDYISKDFYESWIQKMKHFQQKKLPEVFWKTNKDLYPEVAREF